MEGRKRRREKEGRKGAQMGESMNNPVGEEGNGQNFQMLKSLAAAL